MSIPPTRTAFGGALLIAALLAGALPAEAILAASPAPDEALSAMMLGRKNPFRPLQHTSEPLPTLPGAPSAPRLRKPASLERPALKVAYVGIAYDGDESIAAVRFSGKVRFVRQGETLAGATLNEITPEKLIWKRGKRRLESPLHHRPGAAKP